MATDTELRQVADNLRYQYWRALGDRNRADQQPSPESEAAWIQVANVAVHLASEITHNREILDVADNLAATLPTSGMEDGEPRRAVSNFRSHRSKPGNHHGALCTKCVRTADRLVDACTTGGDDS